LKTSVFGRWFYFLLFRHLKQLHSCPAPGAGEI